MTLSRASRSRRRRVKEKRDALVATARWKARLLDRLLADPNDDEVREKLMEIVAEEKRRSGPSLRELVDDLYQKVYGRGWNPQAAP